MGFGNMLEEIEALDSLDMDFQLVTICGNNEKLKKSIDELETQKTIYNYGYVDNVDVFMDAADCIITKTGRPHHKRGACEGIADDNEQPRSRAGGQKC